MPRHATVLRVKRSSVKGLSGDRKALGSVQGGFAEMYSNNVRRETTVSTSVWGKTFLPQRGRRGERSGNCKTGLDALADG
jgi:hypothetical protein